jgi:hypothetical protein
MLIFADRFLTSIPMKPTLTLAFKKTSGGPARVALFAGVFSVEYETDSGSPELERE